MISVKDKDVVEKRFAFQKTIEFHRKMQDLKPNAIFTSTVKRTCQSSDRKPFDINAVESSGIASKTTNYNASMQGEPTNFRQGYQT